MPKSMMWIRFKTCPPHNLECEVQDDVIRYDDSLYHRQEQEGYHPTPIHQPTILRAQMILYPYYQIPNFVFRLHTCYSFCFNSSEKVLIAS